MALLPRVSDVLSKFVAPISSSADQGAIHQRKAGDAPKEGFKREQPKKQPAQPHLRIVKSNDAPRAAPARESQQPPALSEVQVAAIHEGAKSELPEVPARIVVPTEGGLSVAHRILDLFRTFQQSRGDLVRWVGSKTYRKLSSENRKGKFRRGAMLDENVE